MLDAVDTFVIDKTGALKEGNPSMMDSETVPSFDDNVMLAVAAAVEARSEHPLAAAIVGEARVGQLKLGIVTNFASQTGLGVSAAVDGRRVSNIAALRRDSFRVIMLTGDNHETAEAVGRAVGAWTIFGRTFNLMTRPESSQR